MAMDRIINVLLILLITYSCSKRSEHFITDMDYRNQVHQDFLKIKDIAQNRQDQLFGVFDKGLTIREKEALEFLFAYMPLNDLADYNGDFYLKNVKTAFLAKDQFAWGAIIPENIFRHFVLPYRINNENLDTSRSVFLNELKKRLEGLSMYDAALEVNHWCHEKVTYQSTDIRTISPLGAVRSGFGRCGEESTFTVAALRSVGIPARQCYTPRWAHTDDNHAWVEVWIDGTWHYMGACEPEPELDMAWFTGPAKRAMMVHTTVYGKYNGPEKVLNKKWRYSKINLLENYAPVKELFVKIVDKNDKPVKGALVAFKLYNFSELYPIVKKKANNNGMVSITTGLGDLVIWAHRQDLIGFEKVDVRKTDTAIIALEYDQNSIIRKQLKLVPPEKLKVENREIGQEILKMHKKRLAIEDSIRNALHEPDFNEDEAIHFAEEHGYDPDEVKGFLTGSKGNYKVIAEFLNDAQESRNNGAVQLLSFISKKDLRDITGKVLKDHFNYPYRKQSEFSEQIFYKYIFNPRIANEMLVPYKSFIRNYFKAIFDERESVSAENIAKWVNNNIRVIDSLNYYHVPVSPLGVLELGISDEFSRKLLFVAVCRTFEIPARLNEITGIPQYFDGNKWIYMNFRNDTNENRFSKEIKYSSNNDREMKYRIHYTLSGIERGEFTVLEYGWGKSQKELKEFTELTEGQYMLITGNRNSDGAVNVLMKIFKMNDDIRDDIEVKLLNVPIVKQVLGNWSLTGIESGNKKIYSNRDNYLILWIDHGKEPTKHLLNEMLKIDVKEDLKDIDVIVFSNFSSATEKQNLFEQYSYLKHFNLFNDHHGEYLNSLNKSLNDYYLFEKPVVILYEAGDIVYASSGYQIGQVEKLLNLIDGYNL